MTPGSDAMPIREIGYVNHSFPKLDIEAKPFAEITGHMPPDLSRYPHRLSFHHLMLVTAGRGTHRVDFESYKCEPGVVIHVRPGQIRAGTASKAGLKPKPCCSRRRHTVRGQRQNDGPPLRPGLMVARRPDALQVGQIEHGADPAGLRLCHRRILSHGRLGAFQKLCNTNCMPCCCSSCASRAAFTRMAKGAINIRPTGGFLRCWNFVSPRYAACGNTRVSSDTRRRRCIVLASPPPGSARKGSHRTSRDIRSRTIACP